MWGDSHGTWGRCRITLSVPLEGDPMKARVAYTEKGCYMEVGVTASHFFIGRLISHLQKILYILFAWLVSYIFLLGGVFLLGFIVFLRNILKHARSRF
jgi:hypothetical protein